MLCGGPTVHKNIVLRYFGKRRLIDRRDLDAYIDKVFTEEQELPCWVTKAAERRRKDQGKAA